VKSKQIQVSNRSSKVSEKKTHLEQLSLGRSNSLLSTSNENLVGLLIGSLSVGLGEGDLDSVLLLEPDGVLSRGANESRMELLGDGDRDGGLVGLIVRGGRRKGETKSASCFSFGHRDDVQERQNGCAHQLLDLSEDSDLSSSDGLLPSGDL